ncbi:hypothetical protein DL767_002609 [Monosporascus sp. MG133]|nr:hypothetical protein DL767_002609 [Monosporascus sp. MG133]
MVRQLFEVKHIYNRGVREAAPWGLYHPERATAFAIYLFIPRTNTDNEICRQCRAGTSKGPAAFCTTHGVEYTAGACFCYCYSGHERDQREHEERIKKAKAAPEGLQPEHVSAATNRELEISGRMIADKDMERAHGRTRLAKRRRMATHSYLGGTTE